MTESPAAAGAEPKLLTVTLTSEDPRRRSEEIAAAVHEYVTVYRDPPRFLVMHPADYAAVSPHVGHERSLTEGADPIAHRVQPSLDRGAILLADTDDSEWETPDSA
ncbi:MAG: hypothetical protein H0V24_08975 [Chloroflexia bacterium]|nr:hypothetical protein [Chloroflexia bacterium]MDQ3410705.1 hypothetical protein [Chloroflexota bacterium]